MKKVFVWVVIAFVLVIGFFFLRTTDYGAYFSKLSPVNFLAGVFFTDSITVNDLRTRYSGSSQNGKVEIIIVPGHDNESGGTEFLDLKEADLNLALARKLRNTLVQNSRFGVVLTRDVSGYNPDLVKFLADNKQEINSFVSTNKALTHNLISDGMVMRQTDAVIHNRVNTETAMMLYGINLWANKMGASLVLHVHFNDYPGRRAGTPGKHDGFAIYIPEKQFSNARASRAVAEQVFNRLGYYYPSSNLPKEEDGIIEDQELIAIGSFNTLDPVGLLIEYGYIYEDLFRDYNIRDIVFDDLAFQTYLGIEDFFINRTADKERLSAFLPFNFYDNLEKGTKHSRGVLAIQTLLKKEGFYPPVGKDGHACPLSGNFFDCTDKALSDFQQTNGIKGENNLLGPATRAFFTALQNG